MRNVGDSARVCSEKATVVMHGMMGRISRLGQVTQVMDDGGVGTCALLEVGSRYSQELTSNWQQNNSSDNEVHGLQVESIVHSFA